MLRAELGMLAVVILAGVSVTFPGRQARWLATEQTGRETTKAPRRFRRLLCDLWRRFCVLEVDHGDIVLHVGASTVITHTMAREPDPRSGTIRSELLGLQREPEHLGARHDVERAPVLGLSFEHRDPQDLVAESAARTLPGHWRLESPVAPRTTGLGDDGTLVGSTELMAAKAVRCNDRLIVAPIVDEVCTAIGGRTRPGYGRPRTTGSERAEPGKSRIGHVRRAPNLARIRERSVDDAATTGSRIPGTASLGPSDHACLFLRIGARHFDSARVRSSTRTNAMKRPTQTSPISMVLALVFLAIPIACDDKGSDGAAKDKTTADKTEDAGPPAKEGPVTVERIKALDDIKVTNNAADFRKCVSEAEAQLGKVSKVDGDAYWWTATQGEDCHAYILFSDGNNQMARAKGPYKVPSSELDKCRKIAAG